ncbi:MAG: acyl-CoA dehydrogenase family protein [Actinomycetota bacterium]|nr:acyl-CoA dehydrogenase family protein [Actinomycetota bacterium]
MGRGYPAWGSPSPMPARTFPTSRPSPIRSKADGGSTAIRYSSPMAIADFMTMLSRTEKRDGYLGMSMFLVDTDTPGFVVSRKLDKVGQWPSDTAEIFFEDMFITEDSLMGEEGCGFYGIMWELQGERLIAAVAFIDIAEVTLQQV